MADGAIDVNYVAGGAIHGGNERLPVSRPEHVNHLEGAWSDRKEAPGRGWY